jgi:CBS domain-containing protein
MPIRSVRSIIASQTPATADENATALEAAALMKWHGKGALLVLDDTRVIGIVTERDIVFRVVAAERDPRNTRLYEIMTRQPQTIHPDKPFRHALRIMREAGFRHLPVVEDDRPLGIVSSRDALDDDLYDIHQDLSQRADDRD